MSDPHIAEQLLSTRPAAILLFDSSTVLRDAVLVTDKSNETTRGSADQQEASENQVPTEGIQHDTPDVKLIENSVLAAASEESEEGGGAGLKGHALLLSVAPQLELCPVVYVANPQQMATALKSENRQNSGQRLEPQKSASSALNLLGFLRDRVRGDVYVSVSSSSEGEPDKQDFFSLGFQEAGYYPDSQTRLFHFSLRDYKQVPGWLNSKY